MFIAQNTLVSTLLAKIKTKILNFKSVQLLFATEQLHIHPEDGAKTRARCRTVREVQE